MAARAWSSASPPRGSSTAYRRTVREHVRPNQERPRRAASAPRVLVAGGGTGGHAIPALCVADSLKARGAAVEFVGSVAGIEATLVPQAGYTLHPLPLLGLSGGASKRARAGFLFLRALSLCRRLIR